MSVETQVKTYSNARAYAADARLMAAEGWQARFGDSPRGRQLASRLFRRPWTLLFSGIPTAWTVTVTWVRDRPDT
jgi:hypothetical protein